jgi:hypothetical protein
MHPARPEPITVTGTDRVAPYRLTTQPITACSSNAAPAANRSAFSPIVGCTSDDDLFLHDKFTLLRAAHPAARANTAEPDASGNVQDGEKILFRALHA